ncbi:MAG: T9SS type A sorting domain-containing protein [Bacteroidetes bacterium]|nr:T9SS type A sorting domain-containing protein [Bacteroidota bacterium]
MKKFLSLSILVFTILQFAFAQTEELYPLKFNSSLYYSTLGKESNLHQHRYVVDKGTIILTSDTLQLPFFDDFSHRTTPDYKWNENHVTNTYQNVRSVCITTEGVDKVQGFFMDDTAWNYSYNTVSHEIDSVAQTPTAFNFFSGSANCFASVPSAIYYWNTFYRFTFDTLGHKIDSVLAQPVDSFFYAPQITLVQGQPGTLWIENSALINNTYPINPPTIGVATFDGLDEYGLPYNNSSNTTYGFADVLTSKPINLSGLTGADTVYLSYFFEPQGLGDFPDQFDSLIVEFKDQSGIWRYAQWDIGYVNIALVPQKFQQVLIPVPDFTPPNSYYHSSFQFRFRNKSSLYGNNDHWHIDYVKLDKNRSPRDSNIHDIAFQYPLPTILKNYTREPADQFNYPDDLSDAFNLSIHNLEFDANSSAPATNFVRGATELYPTGFIISDDTVQTFNAAEYTLQQLSPKTSYRQPNAPAWPTDSLVTQSRTFLQQTGNTGYAGNDTLYHTQCFDYTMAYDDGSAERGYGLSGVNLKKFALEFNLNHPDTLAGFQIQYSQIDENVSNLIFNINIWDAITVGSATDHPIISLDNKKPLNIDSVSGFATYKLDSAIVFPNKIYVGWAQTDTRNLTVGYDLNSTLGRSHMFVYTNGQWKASTIPTQGSPMIRLILDSDFWGQSSSAVKDLTAEQYISLYPNPTTGDVFISSDRKNSSFAVSVNDMVGQQVKQEKNVSNHCSINELPSGIYLFSITDIETGKTIHRKVIKNSF